MIVSKQKFVIGMIFIGLIILAGNASAKVKVVTTIQPLAYFAERVGGDNVEVSGRRWFLEAAKIINKQI